MNTQKNKLNKIICNKLADCFVFNRIIYLEDKSVVLSIAYGGDYACPFVALQWISEKVVEAKDLQYFVPWLKEMLEEFEELTGYDKDCLIPYENKYWDNVCDCNKLISNLFTVNDTEKLLRDFAVDKVFIEKLKYLISSSWCPNTYKNIWKELNRLDVHIKPVNITA